MDPDRASATGPVAQPTGKAPPPIGKAPIPETEQSRADAAAFFAACALPLLGFLLKMLHPGWALLWFVMISPVLIGVYVAGVVVFNRTFRTRSAIRARFGAVPRRYHVLAWAWGFALFVPPVVIVDSDDSTDYSFVTEILGWAHAPDWYFDLYFPVVVGFALIGVALTIAAYVVSSTDQRRARSGDGDWKGTALVGGPSEPTDVAADAPSPVRSAAQWSLGVLAASNAVIVGVAAFVWLGDRGLFGLLTWLPASAWALVFGWRVLGRVLSDPERVNAETSSPPRRYLVMLWVWGLTVPIPALLILVVQFADLGIYYVDIMLLLVSVLPSVVATVVLWRMQQADLQKA